MADNQSRITYYDGVVRELMISSYKFLNFSKRDNDLSGGFLKQITSSAGFRSYTTGSPQENLNNGDNAPSATTKVSKYPKFNVAYEQIQTDPEAIEFIESGVLAFDKSLAAMKDHVATLMQRIGDYVLYNWAIKPFSGDATIDAAAAKYSNYFGLTTGANRPSAASTTGAAVKKITYQDLILSAAKLRAQNIPDGKIYCLVSSTLYSDIKLLAEAAYNFRGVSNDNGVEVTEMFNINFIERNGGTNVVYQKGSGTNYTPLAFGASKTSTSREAAIFWSADMVWAGMGDIMTFDRKSDPNVYGDVISTQAKMIGYKDNEITQNGVFVLVEAEGA